jgi:hypothetical protein
MIGEMTMILKNSNVIHAHLYEVGRVLYFVYDGVDMGQCTVIKVDKLLNEIYVKLDEDAEREFLKVYKAINGDMNKRISVSVVDDLIEYSRTDWNKW